MTATTPVCPPPATKGAASAVAAPAAPALGAGTLQSLRRFFSSSLAFHQRYSLIAPMTLTITATPAYTKTALETSIPLIELLLWFGVMFSACLLAVVIFQWVIVPLFDWVARRFFA
ncbi:hypothetical protein [Acidovorax sp.]|uniref:hypothetical protein n=1 Tax=Acidovorax sp. TaxID=1872122 RepID=UPI0025C5F581|nr:hypothetical protein [Acidovorax sp.]MBW8465944.1 hypothetical protein [Acidovorax sp.]